MKVTHLAGLLTVYHVSLDQLRIKKFLIFNVIILLPYDK